MLLVKLELTEDFLSGSPPIARLTMEALIFKS
jgi:hypothetical protein